jgi:flagellar motor switch protein FliM
MGPSDPVTLRCGEVDLTQAIMGHIGRNVSLRVSRPLYRPKVTMASFEELDVARKGK